MVIFRLAPQDYHRFHFPISGTIEQFVNIPGCLYTVNPIAVNSKYCNVFTENKRVVSFISIAEFGKVAFVAIGATMDAIEIDDNLLVNSERSLETSLCWNDVGCPQRSQLEQGCQIWKAVFWGIDCSIYLLSRCKYM